jgi:Ca2+-binding EF-hand superfamily protein
MKIIFRNFDLNGDDVIDKTELQKCLLSLGLNADDNEVVLSFIVIIVIDFKI